MLRGLVSWLPARPQSSCTYSNAFLAREGHFPVKGTFPSTDLSGPSPLDSLPDARQCMSLVTRTWIHSLRHR